MDSSNAIALLNQIFEIEKKAVDTLLAQKLSRNLKRMKAILKQSGYHYHNPLNESYDITRLDCEAMIAGESTDQLHIVEVIKPIIFFQQDGNNQIVQKGVVITETINEN